MEQPKEYPTIASACSKPTGTDKLILIFLMIGAFAVWSFGIFCDESKNPCGDLDCGDMEPPCAIGVVCMNYCWMIKVVMWLMFPILTLGYFVGDNDE